MRRHHRFHGLRSRLERSPRADSPAGQLAVLTATAGSAAQVYYETVSANDWGGAESDSDADGTSAEAADWAAALRGTVPTGVLLSAHDVTVRPWAERDHSIVRWIELDTGGHFLPMEAPDQLVGGVRRRRRWGTAAVGPRPRCRPCRKRAWGRRG
ncbi:hypothetical protein [Streptomyces sp. NPDC096068]|uniref:hypothetical protein n=1 Tax=Streptomyces sp. NPDC096068 TaxID=3155424 RepID=UPI003318F2E1